LPDQTTKAVCHIQRALKIFLALSGIIGAFESQPLAAAEPLKMAHFGRPTVVLAYSSESFLSFCTGDFNRDGKGDLALVGDGLAIYLNNGNGFSPGPMIEGGVHCYGASKAVSADMNGDGNPDIIFTSEAGIQVLLGNGHGLFTTDYLHFSGFDSAFEFELPTDFSMIAQDFTEDGNTDVFLYRGDTIALFEGSTNGMITQKFRTNFHGLFCELGKWTSCDLNGDGHLDLIGLPARVCLGRGDGSFVGLDSLEDYTADPASSYTNYSFLSEILGFPTIGSGDFDHDGRVDLVIGSVSQPDYPTNTIIGLHLLRGLGNGETKYSKSFFLTNTVKLNSGSFASLDAITLADMNNDGNLDVVTSAVLENPTNLYVSRFVIFYGDGKGNFHPQTIVAPIGGRSIAVADVTGDRRLDVLTTEKADYPHRSSFISIVPQQLNAIFWQHQDGRLALWQVSGTNIVSSTLLLNGRRVNPDLKFAAAYDFSGDYEPDLLWQRPDGTFEVWNMEGMAVIRTNVISGLQNEPGWSVTALGISFPFRAVLSFGSNPFEDLPNYYEMFWRHTDGRVSVWEMNGVHQTGRLSGPELLNNNRPVNSAWRIVGATDFDRAESSPPYQFTSVDLLWQHTDGWLAASVMDPETLEFIRSFPINDDKAVSKGWRIVGMADFDNNSWADILWQNDDGRVAIWFMKGTKRLSSAFFRGGNPVASEWRILGVN
jgi:hypothetical protein